MSFINDMMVTDSLMLLGKQVPELSGIYDDFNSGSYNSFWQSDFRSNWNLTQYPAASGNYVAVRGQNDDNDLTDSTVDIGGDFNIEVGFTTGANNTGNNSLKLELMPSGTSSLRFSMQLVPTQIRLEDSVTGTITQSIGAFTAYTEYKLRAVRVGSTITFSYDIGSGWVVWTTKTWSGDFWINVEGADLHGISYLDMEADYGLPSSEASQNFLGHRLDRNVGQENDLINMWDGLAAL